MKVKLQCSNIASIIGCSIEENTEKHLITATTLMQHNKTKPTTYSYVVCAVHKTSKEESARSNIVEVIGHLEAYWTTSEYVTLNWNGVTDAVEYNIYKSVNGIFGYVGN